jgi:F-type H+-transporting ATPase subunit delta
MPTDRTLIRKASTIYAEVLLDAAKSEDTVFAVSGQLAQVLALIKGNLELRNTLTDRTLPKETRAGLVREVFATLDPALLEVLVVMVERDDIQLLAHVNEAYVNLAEDELDSVFIDVTTVIELSEELRDSIRKKYSAQFGRGVLLREHTDPSLVGGIVLSAHGRRIDASVASQLEGARLVLSTIPSGGGS